jgi:hypothetical protein
MDEKAARLTANIKAITAEIKADPSWEGEYHFPLRLIHTLFSAIREKEDIRRGHLQCHCLSVVFSH